MSESHVMSGLIAKRRELAGEADQFEKEIKRISAEMKALDVAIKVFNPDFDLRTIKAKCKYSRNRFFKHGEGTQLVLDLLRITDRSLNTVEIALHVAKSKGLELDETDKKAMKASILTVLCRLRANGIIMEAGRDNNHTIRWSLS